MELLETRNQFADGTRHRKLSQEGKEGKNEVTQRREKRRGV